MFADALSDSARLIAFFLSLPPCLPPSLRFNSAPSSKSHPAAELPPGRVDGASAGHAAFHGSEDALLNSVFFSTCAHTKEAVVDSGWQEN